MSEKIRHRANLSCQNSRHVLNCPLRILYELAKNKTRNISGSSSFIVMFYVEVLKESQGLEKKNAVCEKNS